MNSQSIVISSIASLGLLLGGGSSVMAQMQDGMQHAPTEQTGTFHRIEQPLWLKGAVTVGGLGFIGLELWWFLYSKPKSRKATTLGGIQEVTVTVDGGYEPSQITVQAGQPVRLNFDRQDPSNCLEEVRFPEFRIAQELPLNQVTPIEFTPQKPGRYEFTCGMNMFRGVVEVQPAPEDRATEFPAMAPSTSAAASATGNATHAKATAEASNRQSPFRPQP